MSVWYNDNDQFVAEWLRNLIAAGHLPNGIVNENPIQEIKAKDCAPTSHFFAGIGGWAYALQLAGWDVRRPVWTGSCPCQPFSVAGRRGGTTDERHLWPEWFRLIKECRPPTIFGEQVASKDGYAWFDIVQADLESLGYACGMVVSPAAGYGAPHIRHRIYFVADAGYKRLERHGKLSKVSLSQGWQGKNGYSTARGTVGLMADAKDGNYGTWQTRQRREGLANDGTAGLVADADGGDASTEGIQRSWEYGQQPQDGSDNFWADADWFLCTDGKARPTQPGLFPLAHGVPSRVGRLRAYGNAIVPPQAAEFIRAYVAIR